MSMVDQQVYATNICLSDDVGHGKSTQIMGFIAFIITVWYAQRDNDRLPPIISASVFMLLLWHSWMVIQVDWHFALHIHGAHALWPRVLQESSGLCRIASQSFNIVSQSCWAWQDLSRVWQDLTWIMKKWDIYTLIYTSPVSGVIHLAKVPTKQAYDEV